MTAQRRRAYLVTKIPEPGKNALKIQFPAVHNALACSRFSDSGEDAKVKGTQKVGGTGKRKGFFMFALSQFSGPDYLGAWNRLTMPANLGLNRYWPMVLLVVGVIFLENWRPLSFLPVGGPVTIPDAGVVKCCKGCCQLCSTTSQGVRW